MCPTPRLTATPADTVVWRYWRWRKHPADDHADQTLGDHSGTLATPRSDLTQLAGRLMNELWYHSWWGPILKQAGASGAVEVNAKRRKTVSRAQRQAESVGVTIFHKSVPEFPGACYDRRFAGGSRCLWSKFGNKGKQVPDRIFTGIPIKCDFFFPPWKREPPKSEMVYV